MPQPRLHQLSYEPTSENPIGSSVEDAVSASQTKQKQSHEMHSRARDFNLGHRVLVQNYRQGPPWLPGIISSRLGPLTYMVQVTGGQLQHQFQLLSLILLPHFLSTFQTYHSPDAIPRELDESQTDIMTLTCIPNLEEEECNV